MPVRRGCQECDNLVAFLSGGRYDACRILLVEKICDIGLADRPIAMVPNRDTAYVTGEDDEVGLMMMTKLASDAINDQYGLSGVPLVLDGDHWVDWMPPPKHPAYAQLRDLELKTLGPAYHQQEQLLNALHERDGIDVFVASLSAVQKQSGDLVTYCVWGRGVDALLPVAQKVILISKPGEDPVAIGDWDRVRDVVGGLMEPTDDYPPRFRVREFPTEEALAVIGKGEI